MSDTVCSSSIKMRQASSTALTVVLVEADLKMNGKAF